MEACGSARYRKRKIQTLGPDCAQIPPVYVRPYRERQQNVSNDAAAIVEAA